MEDDGMFINIATSSNKPTRQKTANKTDLKKQKYAKKMKQATERNKEFSANKIFKGDPKSAQSQMFEMMNQETGEEGKKFQGRRSDKTREKARG